MKLRSLKDTNIEGKTILYRASYDIDVVDRNGVLEVSDDLRIKATLPTLEYLIKENCKIVILFYVGRPDGQIVEKLRTNPHAKKLSELLGKPVEKIDECIGQEVEEKIAKMKGGEILMLENVRFHPEEMVDDDTFSKELCCGKDMIVFDGFPQAHRMHASTTGIERHLPAVAGFYLESEVNALSGLLENPERPFTVIIGGAKISDKVDAIHNMLKIADNVIVGGAVANVFLKAMGKDIGNSYIEDVFVDKAKREKIDWIEDAKSIMDQAKTLNKNIFYPIDLIVSDGNTVRNINIENESVPGGFMSLDMGPETRKLFSQVIENSKTVFINGPVGKFEDKRFVDGSIAVIESMQKVKGKTIIAGGDTIDFVRKYGNLENYSYASLAGGATLEFLAGKELPALKALE